MYEPPPPQPYPTLNPMKCRDQTHLGIRECDTTGSLKLEDLQPPTDPKSYGYSQLLLSFHLLILFVVLLFNGSVVISINVLVLIPVRTTLVMYVIGIVTTTEAV